MQKGPAQELTKIRRSDLNDLNGIFEFKTTVITLGFDPILRNIKECNWKYQLRNSVLPDISIWALGFVLLVVGSGFLASIYLHIREPEHGSKPSTESGSMFLEGAYRTS